jgi:hypothetical protein
MNLELEFSYRAKVKMPVTVGPGPYGARLPSRWSPAV